MVWAGLGLVVVGSLCYLAARHPEQGPSDLLDTNVQSVAVFGTSHAMHIGEKLRGPLRMNGVALANYAREASTTFAYDDAHSPCSDGVIHPHIEADIRRILPTLEPRPVLAIISLGATDSRPCLWDAFGSSFAASLHRSLQPLREREIPIVLVSPPPFLRGVQTFRGWFANYNIDCDLPSSLHGRNASSAFNQYTIEKWVIPMLATEARRGAEGESTGRRVEHATFYDLYAAITSQGLKAANYANCAHLKTAAYYGQLQELIFEQLAAIINTSSFPPLPMDSRELATPTLTLTR